MDVVAVAVVTVSPVGVAGVVACVTVLLVGLVPPLFVATTVYVYVVPSARPVSVKVRAVPVYTASAPRDRV